MAKKIQSAAPDITEDYEAPLNDGRLKQRFTIPASCRLKDSDPKTIVVHELTSGEVEDSARAITSQANLSSELAKRSIREVDGRKVSYDVVEEMWARWSVKITVLVKQAVNKLHATSDEEDAAFFASAETI